MYMCVFIDNGQIERIGIFSFAFSDSSTMTRVHTGRALDKPLLTIRFPGLQQTGVVVYNIAYVILSCAYTCRIVRICSYIYQ